MASEAVQSLINRQLVGMIGSGGFPANNFSDADRVFLSKIFPSLANRPEANQLLTEVARRTAQRELDKALAWADAREKGFSFEKFERGWRRHIATQDLFGDMRQLIPGAGATGQSGQPRSSRPTSGAPSEDDINAELRKRGLL